MDFDDSTKLIESMTPAGIGGARPRRAYLVVLAGARAGESFPVDGTVRVGRSATVEVSLPADGLSRSHCTLRQLGDGSVVVRDDGSTNGTFVNGERVDARTLEEGDRIQLAPGMVLKFTYQDSLDEDFQRRMYDAALRDGLTGAFNKRYFQDRLETEWAFQERHSTPLSLVMIDLDHFKQINDRFGHPAGDYVLKILAELVQRCIRLEDVFCRYGGEEFAVICREVPMPDAMTLAERVRSSVSGHVFLWEGVRLPVTASFGVAGVPHPEVLGTQQLIQRADEGLYRAKREGRNRVCQG